MEVIVDKNSGFCFGVANAINKAEEILSKKEKLYCLGQMVHNDEEISRLENLGLITITNEEFKQLHNCKVLLRAHGEPPETYLIAKENNIELIDSTCPIVRNLQKKVKKSFSELEDNDKLVIYGKAEHPEIISLAGQCNNEAIVVKDEKDLDKLNFEGSIKLFSQTTNNPENYNKISKEIQKRLLNKNNDLDITNSICRDVASREGILSDFAKENDIVIFTSGKNSSNGKMLYNQCIKVNPNTYFISSVQELKSDWFSKSDKVGVCGSTSTPAWLMEEVATKIKTFNNG